MDGGSDQAGQDMGWMEEVIRLVRTWGGGSDQAGQDMGGWRK